MTSEDIKHQLIIMKSREVELGSHSRMVCLAAAQVFLNSCFSDAVFVTLLRAAVEKQLAKYKRCFALGGVDPPP